MKPQELSQMWEFRQPLALLELLETVAAVIAKIKAGTIDPFRDDPETASLRRLKPRS